MAQWYPTGSQKIFYSSEAFKTGLTITADIILPNMSEILGVAFTEYGGGRYFAVFNFVDEGLYLGTFYENGAKKLSHSFFASSLRSGDVSTSTGNHSIIIPQWGT